MQQQQHFVTNAINMAIIAHNGIPKYFRTLTSLPGEASTYATYPGSSPVVWLLKAKKWSNLNKNGIEAILISKKRNFSHTNILKVH